MYISNHYDSVPVETKEIAQSLLNIEDKSRSNPLKWKGQFSPQLIEVLLNTYASSTDIIFDPFLGSGTVILEAGRMNLTSIGTEVNPAAYILSSIYKFMNCSQSARRRYLTALSYFLDEKFEQEYKSNTIKKNLASGLDIFEDEYEILLLNIIIVMLDFENKKLTLTRLLQTYNHLKELVIQLPYGEKAINIYNADARQTSILDSTIDLVLTSPPYINVFNYHQQYRKSLEFLNYDILKIAKSEIGANRKHRSNRFLTVIQYCLDIGLVFNELIRICGDSARIIFVVGRESSVRGTPFYNSEIVTEIAHAIFGLNLQTRQKRSFRNRFGKNIYEDILHFELSNITQKPQDSLINDARLVAQSALEASLKIAPTKSSSDIKDALSKIDDIKESPLFTNTHIKIE